MNEFKISELKFKDTDKIKVYGVRKIKSETFVFCSQFVAKTNTLTIGKYEFKNPNEYGSYECYDGDKNVDLPIEVTYAELKKIQ
jgi:hypothetical protein